MKKKLLKKGANLEFNLTADVDPGRAQYELQTPNVGPSKTGHVESPHNPAQ